jgi:hypothetical protein
LIGGLVLVGCATSEELKARIAGRWGPDPSLPSSEVNNVMQNQAQALGYIINDSESSIGTVTTDAAGQPRLTLAPADWYRVAEWGFNVGRQDCEIYMDNLFRMNREKQRNDSVFTALNTAAAAIITGTSTAQKPLSILAATFGLSSAINDAVFQSYLFTEAPGLVSNKVKDLQDTYRQAVEKAETDKQNPILINTPESAYNAIQNYYHICLPESIEGTLLQTVADRSAQNTKPANPPTPPKKAAKQTGSTPAAATLNMSPALK